MPLDEAGRLTVRSEEGRVTEVGRDDVRSRIQRGDLRWLGAVHQKGYRERDPESVDHSRRRRSGAVPVMNNGMNGGNLAIGMFSPTRTAPILKGKSA